jgi:hypothetical protein
LPTAFVEFWRRGFCTILGPRNTGPDYIWLPDVEWLSLEDIRDYQFPKYLNVQILLLPFAEDAAGSPYCFMIGRSDGMPVIWCASDCPKTEIYAPDFSAAVFRSLLGQATQWLDLEWLESERKIARNSITQLRQILPDSQIQLLDGVYGRQPQSILRGHPSHPKEWNFLMSNEEFAQIMKNEFPDFDSNTAVQWSGV